MYFEHDHNQPSSWTKRIGTLKQFGDDDQTHFALMLQNWKHYNSRFLCNSLGPNLCVLSVLQLWRVIMMKIGASEAALTGGREYNEGHPAIR